MPSIAFSQYVVAAHGFGDDMKTVWDHPGHAIASFTLGKYGYITEQIKRDSADRMRQHTNEVKKICSEEAPASRRKQAVSVCVV